MKAILAKLMIFMVGVAVVSCLTAAAQAGPIEGQETGARGLRVDLDLKTLTKCSVRPNCTMTYVGGNPVFSCDHFFRDLCFSFTRTASDIREINLDGLKKILQRDPKDTRPLLINFWATWCDPCRDEFPDLVKVDNDYRSKGLNFVSISLDDVTDIKSAVPKFLKEMKAEMSVVLLNVNDPEPAIKVVDPTWDGQLPATFLYNKDGKIIFKHFGRINSDELRTAIDKQVMNSK